MSGVNGQDRAHAPSTPAGAVTPLLEIAGLSIAFPGPQGEVRVVDDVSFSMLPGECIGIVGESGSGKTMTALASMRLVPSPGRVIAGRVLYQGRDLMTMSEEDVRKMRGVVAGLVPQNPMSALNPVLRVGFQIREAMDVHDRFAGDEARRRVPALMSIVGIGHADSRQHDFPHQFSGGMRQRACIAMAMANDPAVIVADEPTTGLDVTVKGQVIRELARLRAETRAGVIVITHDMDVIARLADRVIVMYAGQVVESGATRDLLTRPEHPYTWSLMRSAPTLEARRGERLPSITGMPPSISNLPPGCRFHPRCPISLARCRNEEPALAHVSEAREARCIVLMSKAADKAKESEAPGLRLSTARSLAPDEAGRPGSPMVRAQQLAKRYRLRQATGGRRYLEAVRSVDLDIRPGETLGLVGESGSGKSTLGRLLISLERPSSGSLILDGVDAWGLSARDRRSLQRRTHMIFQDPYSAFDPRMRIADSIAEPLGRSSARSDAASRRTVQEVIESCGLTTEDSARYPHELSGGQLQRASIARALVGNPSFVVADEPVASLDVSIQAQIINLLAELQQAKDVTFLFISHDLAVVRNIADRIGVMYSGSIVELGLNEQLYSRPRHPYTKLLLAAAGGTAEAGNRPAADEADEVAATGCRFRNRCPWAQQICTDEEPAIRRYPDGGQVACHFSELVESSLQQGSPSTRETEPLSP